MDNEQYRKELRLQLKDALGKIMYTYTAHYKFVDNCETQLKNWKYAQITLSAISLISTLLNWTILSSLLVGALLALTLYAKEFNLSDDMAKHQDTANKLWSIREDYISFLTDMKYMSIESIIDKRDVLKNKVSDIYSNSPKTDSKSYKKAQKAIKEDEEQFFHEHELNDMLPEHLRSEQTSRNNPKSQKE